MTSSLAALLNHPKIRMCVVGPKPVAQRAVMAVVLTLGSLSTALAHPAEPTEPVGVPVAAIEGAQANAGWLELPTSPFLEVGMREGQLSMAAMVDAWRAAGMDTDQAREAFSTLAGLTPTAMGVSDPRLEAHLKTEAQASVDRLEQLFPKAHATLARAVNNKPATQTQRPEEWQQLLESFQNTRSEPAAGALLDSASSEQARQAMIQTAGKTGLRSLRMPLANWESPGLVVNLARGLETANAELAYATGWEGRVLGLGGRLELTIGQPMTTGGRAVEALALGSRDGRVEIVSPMATLTHEWVHGLDYVLGRTLIGARGTLSDERGMTETVWGLAQDDIETASPQWTAARQDQAAKDPNMAPYWLDESEVMAYAISAWLTRQHANTVARDGKLERMERDEPFRIPTADETKAQHEAIKGLFVKLKPLGLTQDTPSASLSGLLEQRRTRQATIFEQRIPFKRTLR